MKKEQLKELGLNDDLIKKIMDINGKDIQNAKEKATAGSNEALEENQALKDQLKERDKDLKTLRAQAKDNKELSNSYKELQDKYSKDTADLTTKLNQTRLNSALNTALTKAKVRNPKSIKGLLDMQEIKLDKEGNLTGLDDQISKIKQTDSYLFDEGKEQNYAPSNGKPAGTDQVQEMVDVFKGDKN